MATDSKAIVARIPDACGDTRLSSFLVYAILRLGPGWFVGMAGKQSNN